MKELAQAHAEKLVLGICLVIMLSFLWSAFSMATYDKDPTAFEKIERTASQNVASSKASLDGLQARDFSTVVEKLQQTPDTTSLDFEKRWRRPFDFGLSFRNQPNILRPDKPVVQLNRAPLRLFKTDLDGKRIVRKVRGGEAKNVARPLGGGDNRPNINSSDIEKIRALGFEPDEAAFFGNEHIFSILGLQQVDTPAAEPHAVAAGSAPIGNRQPTRSRLGDHGHGVAAPKSPAPGATPKADAFVEEFVLSVVGREWVEVVASFPHAEQIKEYVKALRERADFVGLRYSRVEVQRQELDANMEWYPPEWQNVPLKEQWEVIQNAFGWEPDPYASVTLKGLAMHIPSMYTPERPYLDTPELVRPTPPEYTAEELDPKRAQKEKPKRTRKTPADTKQKKEFKGRFVAPPPLAGGDGVKAVFDNGYLLKNAMIRFWDFTVVPGKRYRYRVRVNVINPNFDRADVADRQFATEKYLVGEWSEPSDEIYIQPNVLWFVGEKQQSNRPDRVNLEVQSWSREIGEWVVNEFIQRPGDVIGVKGSQPPVSVLRWNERTQKFDASNETLSKAFDTNQILLDTAGGLIREPVPGGASPKQFKLPREVVSVNVYGDLIRRSEDVDRVDESRQRHKQRYQEMANEANPGRANTRPGAVANPDDGAIDPLSPAR